MVNDLEAYVKFFELVDAAEDPKTESFEKQNAPALQRAMKSKEGRKYFRQLSGDVKTKYLLYLMFKKEDKPKIYVG